MLKVGLKLCGSCNPFLNMSRLIGEIKRMPDLGFVSWQQPPYSLLVIINGCSKSCASRPSFEGPVLVFEGKKTKGSISPEQLLIEQIKAGIEDIIRKGCF